MAESTVEAPPAPKPTVSRPPTPVNLVEAASLSALEKMKTSLDPQSRAKLEQAIRGTPVKNSPK